MFTSILLTSTLGLITSAQAQYLGSAAQFGVLAASTVTNTGDTIITGALGVFPGTAMTGFGTGPGLGTATSIHSADGLAQQAQLDATSAYTALAALPPTNNLTGTDLGGQTLPAGIYHFSSSAGLTGILTLDGANDPNSVYVFQIGSTLTTATASTIALVNGAKACNVYWQVGSSATLGTATQLVGNVVALASITANAAVGNEGGLYALTSAVTMINDTVAATSNFPAVGRMSARDFTI